MDSLGDGEADGLTLGDIDGDIEGLTEGETEGLMLSATDGLTEWDSSRAEATNLFSVSSIGS